MPSKRMAIEWLNDEVRKGRGDEPCHIVDITKEARARAENAGPKPKTRFQMETDDPELYRQFNIERSRIIKRTGNKSVALTLLLKSWQWMTDALIDKVLAEQEGPPQ